MSCQKDAQFLKTEKEISLKIYINNNTNSIPLYLFSSEMALYKTAHSTVYLDYNAICVLKKQNSHELILPKDG